MQLKTEEQSEVKVSRRKKHYECKGITKENRQTCRKLTQKLALVLYTDQQY